MSRFEHRVGQGENPFRDRAAPADRSVEFVLELPSELRAVEGAVSYLVEQCRAFDFGGSRLTLNFRVGVTEALANAILYGNKRDPTKRVRVEVALSGTHVALRVVDEGQGFDPSEIPDPTTPDNLQRAGGRGIFLIRKLMDEVEYNASGNAVRLVLYRTRRAPAESSSA